MSQLPVKELANVSASNGLPLYETNLANPRFLSYGTLLDAIRRDLTSQQLIENIQTPGTGATIQLATGQNTWLILRPTGSIALLSITLPNASQAVDGQEILVNNTNQISSLAINSDISHTVYGAPAVLAAEDSFTLKFNLNTLSWYAS